MALTGRQKTIALVASILIVGVVIASALAVGLSFKVIQSERREENAPSQESLEATKLIVGPKYLTDGGEIAEEGHFTFLLEDTDVVKLDAVIAEIEKKSVQQWELTGNFSAIGAFSMRIPELALKAIAMPLDIMEHVLYIEPVYKRSVDAATNLWGLDRLDQNAIPLDGDYTRPTGLSGSGVNAYVLDTGIMSTHTQFGNRVKTGISYISDGRGTKDCHGHGTHVAGTIGGSTYGVAPNVNLYPVRVLGCDGSGSSSGVIKGINWVADNAVKPAVGSMSLGGGYSVTENTAVERAITKGIPFVVSAGNSNVSACNQSPASATSAITVGASDRQDARAYFSNWGSCVDLFAPGVSIQSCGISSNTATATMSGTSMAAPHVSGVVALYLQSNPTATAMTAITAVINGAITGKITDLQGSPDRLLNVDFLEGLGVSTTTASSTSAASSTAPSGTTGTPTGLMTETGSFTARNQQRLHPGGTYYRTTATKTHTATLTGPTVRGVDFDLALMKYNPSNGRWTVVKNSSGSTSSERISVSQSAGYYAWRVSSHNGVGDYTLTFQIPR